MATEYQNEPPVPIDNRSTRRTADLLPRYYRTDSNKKFLSATLDQLVQPGTVKKLSGYIGRLNSKSVNADDIFLAAASKDRQDYQLEPAAVVQDKFNNVTFYKDYLDHINHIKVFGGNVDNHERLNRQEFYSWNPHICWDKFVNFQQYYWLPYGPNSIEIQGQQKEVISTFTVTIEDQGDTYAYVFNPDGLTRNPTLTLFRGQTYKFEITSENNPFSIKTSRTADDLNRYELGVSHSAVENGTITFTVALNAPNVLFYCSEKDADVGGTFQIQDIDENTYLDLDKDLIGKKSYTLPSGISLSNGMKVTFSGLTTPEYYQQGAYYIEGVGTAIRLIPETDLEIIGSYTEETSLLFDDDPFDKAPWSSQTALPKQKDYVVINRSSIDRNPWTRINRWFHQDIILQTATARGEVAELDQAARATRPIIEFNANIKLYNNGHQSKTNIDVIDNFTTDVFSTIEGSLGYNIDGIDLAHGMRVIFTADTDRLVNGKTFVVNFIEVTVPNRQIEFYALTGVNVSTDVITCIAPHSLTTGNQVLYLNEGNVSIDGLVHRKSYYVKVLDTSRIELYTDKLLVNKVDIFALGSGTHSLEVFSGFRRQINLVEAEDSVPVLNQTVLVNRGIYEEVKYKNELGEEVSQLGNQGLMYWYNGTSWKLSQVKYKANQPPLFDIFDSDENSYSDIDVYDGTSFTGTKIFSYKQGTGTADSQLGFALSYQNINNIGDIVFEFNLLQDIFSYKNVTDVLTKGTDVGYVRKITNLTTYNYENGWQVSAISNIQPIVRIFKQETKTLLNGTIEPILNNFSVDVYDYPNDLDDLEVRVYINGKRQNKDTFTVIHGDPYKKVVLDTDVTASDIVTLKCYAAQPKNSNGHYELPLNLQNNPLNSNLSTFTLGQVIDHVDTIVDNITTFNGTYPGYGNLRDIGNLSAYGTRFVQHSGPLNLSLYHLGSQTVNVFKALQQAREDYGTFKRSFLTMAVNIGVETETRPFVDLILEELLKERSKNQPYYLSDMFAYAGSKRSEIIVLDGRIKTYPLSEAFNLSELSNRSVLIYLNGVQLLHGRDYQFGTDIFFTINDSVSLAEDDVLEIYEYESTDGSYCPPTPTKLGLYPLFEPKIYIDDTYLESTEVIQGHDGSITIAYGDYRDDLLLELENRIYNNVKVSYNSDIFNVFDYIPGYDRESAYAINEYNNILSQFFFQWTNFVNEDFSKITTWDINNTFTYNFRNNFTPDNKDVPAYWRGIYRYLLDTDRPHTHPWECLGYSIQPSWWSSVYGVAPYTKDNFILWDDIRQGIVRQPGFPIRVKSQFAKSILNYGTPVDEDGNLISPVDASFVQGNLNYNNTGYYVFGDHAPVETAWRRSSYYPFAIIQTALLMHPNKVLATGFDRSRIIRNLDNQLVYDDTNLRIKLSDLKVPSTALSSSRILTAGLVNYVIDLVTSDTDILITAYKNDLQTLTNKISSKLGGFTTKPKFKLLLDSKNPTSSGGVFIPEENYSIHLNTSSPIEKIVYSGVLITKYGDGYEIRGYNRDQPYFKYYPYIRQGRTINVGGISESYVTWAAGKYYLSGQIVDYNNQYYRVILNHTSSVNFEEEYYAKLAKLPVIGGREAVVSVAWDDQELTLSYGTKLTHHQEVVDFLYGYSAYLISKGFVYDQYNPELKSIDNWETSVKEFLFWTTQNWSAGSAISLSPSANILLLKSNISVVDDIRNSFFGYQVYRVDGEKLDSDLTNTYRENNDFVLAPKNTNHGVYGAVLYLVQKEHIVLLDNKTLFNDIIYDLEPGYRQERIKVKGYISTNWNGGFNVPGFIYDQAKIQDWESWTDYNLGDIVKYKEFYYAANKFLPGAEKFNNDDWAILSEKPESKLISNFDYNAEQFTDFYDLDSDNFNVEQQRLAQHLIGYQKRQYLENIIQDDVSQYKFYQGMIIEKGTQNVFNKLFDVLSSDDKESLTFNEEWALRVGTYGAIDITREIEFNLDETQFKLNPQPVELVNSIDPDQIDFVYRQLPSDVYIKPQDYDNNVWSVTGTKEFLRTPGYVRYEDVKINLDKLEDIIDYDITPFSEGDYVWCAFENPPELWNVYRLTQNTFKIQSMEYAAGVLTLTADKIPDIIAGDIIGLDNLDLVKGFYVVKEVFKRQIRITKTITNWDKDLYNDSSPVICFKFIKVRIDHVDNANNIFPSVIKEGETFWADNNGLGLKSVYRNSAVYGQRTLTTNTTSIANNNFGKTVAMADNGRVAAVADNNRVTIFVKNSTGTNWVQQDVKTFDPTISSTTNLNFGAEICFSPDGEWLAISAPTASDVKHVFKGDYDGGSAANPYVEGDVVQLIHKATPSKHIYLNTHWRAVNNIIFAGDWSTIDKFSQDWEPANLIDTDSSRSASGYSNQGYVNLYYRSSGAGSYTLAHSFVSPNPVPPGLSPGEAAAHPAYNEKFGSKMSITKDGDDYVLAVTSAGYNSNQGRVYLYRYGTLTDDSSVAWRMDYDRNYKGTFDSNVTYRVGDIVFYNYNLYECVAEPDFQNPIPEGQSSWSEVTRNNILGFFPQESTVDNINNEYIIVNAVENEFVESVRQGDSFGYDVDFSNDGSVLIISAPAADQVTYDQYKGPFRTSWKYLQDDVVYFSGSYYRYILIASSNPIGGFDPDHWELLTSDRILNTGKVFVYNKTDHGYQLSQVLGSDNFELETKDRFGESIAITDSGTKIAVSSSYNDVAAPDAGRVIIFKQQANSQYTLQQKLYNYKAEAYERFGSYVDFMNDDQTLVVFAANGDVSRTTTYDEGALVLDSATTRFIELQVDSGRVDIFDKIYENYIFGESLDTSDRNDITDRYGSSISVGKNNIFVGARREDGSTIPTVMREGYVYAYYKIDGDRSWTVLHEEAKRPNLNKIKQIYFYNNQNNKLITYVDVVDPIQGKIPGPAEQEIRYKTYFDPATYSIGTSSVNVNEGMAWSKKQVGTLWWDLSRAKFLDNQLGSVLYRSTTWNKLYDTASIDIYEWVESKYLPADWNKLSGTDKGNTLGISGTTKYDNTVYSVRKRYDNVAKSFTNLYYYWIKNSTVVPNIEGRKLSAQDVADLISDPINEGYTCVALTASNSFSLVNANSILEGKNINLNFEYYIVEDRYKSINTHSQWKIISEHENTVIPKEIETKWIHSLIGKDDNDRVVPNTKLPFKLQYGIGYRPRQSMFVNRIEALKEYTERVNSILSTKLIADDYDLSDLSLAEPKPSSVSGLWDREISVIEELRFIGTATVQTAVLTPVIVNGRITEVLITNSGSGYVNAPYVTIKDQGTGGKIKCQINAAGQVTGVLIENQGEGYSDTTILTVRPFSVLVASDTNTFDKWSIYEWNSSQLKWDRTRSQSYDVTRYWSYLDWYATGYDQFTKIDHLVNNTYELAQLSANIGQVVKVANIGTGGWLLLYKFANNVTIDFTENFSVVGRQNGTIQFSSSLYDYQESIIGFDGDLFDSNFYDNLAVKELRIIINTIKDKIFVDELYQEYLRLFLSSVRYALHEQTFLDWAMKTSFVKATHNVGQLKEKVTYNNDSLENYEDYVKEVKPYRTQIREYLSSYDRLDNSATSVTDFDLLPVINSDLSIDNLNAKFISGTLVSNYDKFDTYPWKHWKDNVGFKIIDIVIADGGSGYIANPVVRINGGYGSGAVAKAYIANGTVSRIQIVKSGTGYLNAPEIVLDGGLGVSGVQGKAVAIIETEAVRANKIAMKFDRITRNYFISELEEIETFTGTGSKLQFQLKFSPLLQSDTHSVVIDGVDVLKEDYVFTIKTSVAKGYTSYYGLVTLTTAPEIGADIQITYTKSWHHLSAADRINFYYTPTTGMYGKDLAQLMTGIDYGGVNVTGLDFNIIQGWASGSSGQDVAPDAWDAYDNDFSDYIVTVADSTYTFTLPYTPSLGQRINVYISSKDPITGTYEAPRRIDDPYFNSYDGSTVQSNGRTVAPAGTFMQTIVGDGTTDTFSLPALEATPPLDINQDDKVYFRKESSDGSYAPRTEDYDTQIYGGAFDGTSLTSATGFAPDDINMDGDGLITPMTSHAPEEIVPGQILDTVAIKVYQLPTSGSSKILFKNYIGDGSTATYSIAQFPQNTAAIFVKRGNLIIKQGVDYTVDWVTRTITLTTELENRAVLSVISFGVASYQLLDVDYFVSDGSTLEYITNAPWRSYDLGHIVLVDGATVIYEIFETDETYIRSSCVGIRLGTAPSPGQIINYMITSDSNYSASIIKNETLAVDGSTTVYPLTNTLGVKDPLSHNLLVMIDGEIINPGKSEYFYMKDNNLTYNLSKYKSIPYTLNPAYCKVYKDGVELNYGSEYYFDFSIVSIVFLANIYTEGSLIAFTNQENAPYTIEDVSGGYTITFASAPSATSEVEIISFYNHDVQEIVRQQESTLLSGALDVDTPDYFRYHSLAGKKFKLHKPVMVDDYVWVIKNNQMLTHSVDYFLNPDLVTVTLADSLITSDILDIIIFGSNAVTEGYGFMQFKDMLNRTHYKRLNKLKSTRLGQSLAQRDQTIVVKDGSVLSTPNPSLNLPGVVEINGERIEYFTKSGNVLGQLRRGTLGTGCPELHAQETLVQDIGYTETIPYADTTDVQTVIADGSTLSVDIDYIPNKTNTPSWYRDTIPTTYGQSDEVDVFVGGYRLKKVPYNLFLESNGYPYSIEGDSEFEAEFSVDGTSSAIRLTQPVGANVQVKIIKKTGKLWTETGQTITESQSAIAKFLKDTPTNYPEYPTE